MTQSRAVVVGGGIAGLAATAGLLRAGWSVTVLEQAPAFGEIGAGLAITHNGMAALDAIGCADAVRAAGWRITTAGTRTETGRWLMRVPDDPVAQACGMHRRRLHAVLLAAADGAELITGVTVGAVDPGGRVRWRAGDRDHERDVDLVVGADGLRSTVRGQLFPAGRPAYTGKTCWRAVVDGPADDRFAVTWGPGSEFGAFRTGPAETCWYLYVQAEEGTAFPDELAAARERVAGWSPDVRELIAGTDPARLVRHDVFHLAPPLPSYVRGRAVLVGDAAHALVPTMGQGANTALEDAVSLGPLLRSHMQGENLDAGLQAYDAARRPRTQAIARRSLLTQRFGADLTGRRARAARDLLFRALPAGPFVRAATRSLQWEAPG